MINSPIWKVGEKAWALQLQWWIMANYMGEVLLMMVMQCTEPLLPLKHVRNFI